MAGYEYAPVPDSPDAVKVVVTGPADEAAVGIYDICRQPLRPNRVERCWTDDGYVMQTPAGQPDRLMPKNCAWDRQNRCRVAAGKLVLELQTAEEPAAPKVVDAAPLLSESRLPVDIPPSPYPLTGADERAAQKPRPPMHPGELEPGGPLL